MSSNNSAWRKIAPRFAADALILVGFWIAPSVTVWAGLLLAAVLFRWYAEALLIGFLAGAVSGLPSWKLVLAFGCAIGCVEALKRRFEPRQWLSYLPFAAAAAVSFAAVFFIVL
ncbi:MAG: hypothetical protein HYS44_02745 [Candidatus Niyogibacteria bacterium]|nr:hypothetical protein [Candidatus Niyogibacteria bacterium]